jgi:hypothetical protein
VHISDVFVDDAVEVAMHRFVCPYLMICRLEDHSEGPDSCQRLQTKVKVRRYHVIAEYLLFR